MLNEALLKIIEPTVVDMGYELWGLEYITGGNNILLRVFIDSEKGVDVDSCAQVSRQLSAVLDVEDLIKSEYRLEISSPGVARSLFKLEQFSKYLNHLVKVKLKMTFEGRRQIKGQLVKVDLPSSQLVIVDGDDEYELPYELVDKAQLIPVYE